MTVAQHAGWWWPMTGGVVITERPVRLERDTDGRLHSGTGMAIGYPDGWGVYAWHGMRVSAQIIEAPETLTVAQIRDEENAEVRRVMLERFGMDRYLRESGATVIDRSDYGTLYRAEISDDEPLVMVEVENSTPEPDGSFKHYTLRVPPTMTRARDAVAWTFGFSDGAQYDLAVQT
jgi:hypothetical protein